MKSSSFDLEELNCWNKNLDVGVDASERNLDSFLHETCLLAEFSCHFCKLISPSYDIVFMKFGALIGLCVRNPIKLNLHHLNFCSSRYSIRNGQRSTLPDCKIWLWRLRFPCSSLFYFLAFDFQKGMDVSFLIPLESLYFDL
jgi:hypothetical protein